MAFSLRNFLTAVQTRVAALPTVLSTSAQGYMGVPESFQARINYFITLGPSSPNEDAFGGESWAPQVTVVFGYRVQANESTAELIIADLVLELVDAVNTDPSFGGIVDADRTTLDMSGASMPEYRAIAGSEARLYPVTITGYQQRRV